MFERAAKITHFFAHALPLLSLLLMGAWMGNNLTSYVKTGSTVVAKDISGFSWAYADAKVFNWHPLLMTFGFVFCATQAALVYITLPFDHATNKKIHFSLHGIGFLSAIIGVIAVFRFHNEHNITNMYSLHSWLGITTMVLFGLIYLVTFVTFYYPGAIQSVRVAYMPFHIGAGISVLALTLLTSATGILEKLSFNASCNVSGSLDGNSVAGFMANDCKLGNTIGLFIALSLVAVVMTIYHARHTQKKQSDDDENAPLVPPRYNATNPSV